MLKIGPAAKLLGVSKDTLRRWEASGKITSKRTRKGYRVYDPEQLKTLIKPEPKGLKIGEAAKTLGVSIDTLRRWAKKGKLKPQVAKSGYRIYDPSQLLGVKQEPVPLIADTLPQYQNVSKDNIQAPTPQPLIHITDITERALTKQPEIPVRITPFIAPVTEPSLGLDLKAFYTPLLTLVALFVVALPLFLLLNYIKDIPNGSKIFQSSQKSFLAQGADIGLTLVESFSPSLSYRMMGNHPPESPPGHLTQKLNNTLSPAQMRDLGYLNGGKKSGSNGSVLAESTPSGSLLQINLDTQINGLLSGKEASFSGQLTAPNVLYTLTPGANVTITGDPQRPTISSSVSIGDASTTTKGIASFSSTNFSVTDGAVSLATGGVANSNLSSSSITINTSGTLSGGGAVSLGGSITLTGESSGVTSIAGTANQVIASASTGDVTLSLPQDIDSSAAVEFSSAELSSILLNGSTSGQLTLQTAAATTDYTFTLPSTGGTSGYVLTTDGSGTTSWISASGLVTTWDSIDNPVANQTLAMSTFTTNWNWATGTGTDNLFNITSDASSNGTGSLVNIQTGASSTLLPLRIRAGSVEAISVNSSGNVGIGTTNPGAKLEIDGRTLIATTNTTGADLAITNTGVYTSTGIFNLTADSANTGDIFRLSAAALTSGSAMVISGPAGGAGVTDDFVKINSDIGDQAALVHLSPRFTGSSATGFGLRVSATDGTSSANSDYNIYSELTLTGSAAKTAIGINSIVNSSSSTADTLWGILASNITSGALSSGTRTMYGIEGAPTSTANSSGGTLNIYGGYFDPSSTGGSTGAGSTLTNNVYALYASPTGTYDNDCGSNCALNTYGLYVANGTSNTNGTSKKWGLFVAAQTGADENYGAYFGSNVGIGTSAPAARLAVGDGTDELQVSSVGDVTFVDANDGASITGPAGGALLVTAPTNALNLQSDGSIDVNIAGGAGATGCTINNTTGALNCAGSITGGSSGVAGYWNRTGTTIAPATSGDSVDVGNGGNFTAGLTTGKIGFGGTVSGSDYLMDITLDSTQDWSRGINITQANDSNEDSSVVAIANTLNAGSVSATREIKNIDLSLTPTATIAGSNSISSYGIYNISTISSLSIGTTGTSNGLNAYGSLNQVSGSPTINNSNSNQSLQAYGVAGTVSISPTLTAVGSASLAAAYAGYFQNATSSAGNSNLTFDSYGTFATVSGNLTTTGTTTHYGFYSTVSGTADNNYGSYINSVADGTNNYGLYINTVAAAATNYAIYSNAAAQSYIAGNVGIGTTAPQSKLHILGTTDPNVLLIDSVGTVASNLTGRRANGTVGAETGVVADDNLLVAGGNGYTSAASYTSNFPVRINMQAAGTWSGVSTPSQITFSTTPSASTSIVERMRIQSDGNVGIGTTAATSQLHILKASTNASASIESDSGNAQLILDNSGSPNNSFISFQGAGSTVATFGLNSSDNTIRLTHLGVNTFVSNNGNVGIGTTAPAGVLDVVTPTSTATGAPRFLTGSTTTGEWSDFYMGAAHATYRTAAFRYFNGQGVAASSVLCIFNYGDSCSLNIIGGGNVGVGTTAPIAKLQVHTTSLDQNLYLSSTAPSLSLGNNEVRGSATMNSIFALATSAAHFGVAAGDLTIANYGASRGDIYINSNYSGAGTTDLILQPTSGNVGIADASPDGLLDLDSSATTTNVFGITNTGVFTGSGTSSVAHITANSLTSGDLLTLSTTGCTSCSALKITGATSSTISIDHLVQITANNGGNGAGTLFVAPNFTGGAAGAAVTSYGIYVNGTDSTNIANAIYGTYSFLTVSGAPASQKVGFGVRGQINNSSTTADTMYGGYFDANNTGDNTSGTKSIVGVGGHPTNTADSNIIMFGGYFTGNSSSVVTGGNSQTLYGVLAQPQASGASTNGTIIVRGLSSVPIGSNFGPSGGNTVNTEVTGLFASPTNQAASACSCTVTTYGVFIQSATVNTNGTSNNYGLFVNSQSGADTNYQIYSAGTAASYYAGNIGIRQATPVQDLHIKQQSNSQTTGGIRLERSDTTAFGTLLYGADNNTYIFNNSNATAAYTNGSSWTFTSDRRLKENLATLPANTLDIISGLTPYTYDMTTGNKNQAGFIAQDVLGILPNAVSVDINGYYGLNYDYFIPFLTKGIQELNLKVESALLTLDPQGLASGNLDAENITVSSDIVVGGLISASNFTLDASLLNRTGSLASVPVNPEGKVSVADSVNALNIKLSEVDLKQASQSSELAEARILGETAIAQAESLDEKVASTSANLSSLSAQIQELLNSTADSTNSSSLPSAPDDGLTPPEELLTASSSATLANLKVTDKVSTINLETLDATISGTFKALGENFLGKTTVAGDLTVDGTLAVTEGNSISAFPVLFLQNNPLAQAINIFNGKVTINKDGAFTAETIIASEYKTISGKISGSGRIPAGLDSVDIKSTYVRPNSRILITPTTQTALPVSVISKIDGEKFTASIQTPAATDITFDWFIINEQ